MTVTIGQQISSGIWEVFCVDCMEFIGTFDYPTLSVAIKANRDKGGIKCVKCRGSSCRGCGLQLDGIHTSTTNHNLCIMCELELKILETQKLAQLYQKSKGGNLT